MDIMRALTYAFDDREWVTKLGITLIITAISLLLTPVFVGLLGWAALMGYVIDLVRNVRRGSQTPLPAWDNFSRYVSNGANVLVAVIVYSLPNLLLGCVGSIVAQNMSSGFIGSTLVLALSCCLFPVLLVYSLITVPMIALGIGRYVEDPRINVFFEFSFLLENLRKNIDQVIQWWLAAIVANIVFLILGVIPVIGWAIAAALLVPVYGMLTGQFALAIFGKLKEKPKNQPPANPPRSAPPQSPQRRR